MSQTINSYFPFYYTKCLDYFLEEATIVTMKQVANVRIINCMYFVEQFFSYRLSKFSFCFCFCRSFDSQNNNRGGYNVGDDGTMYYYTDSVLPIQWFALNSSWLYKPFNVLLFLKGQINIRVTMLILIALSYCSTHVPIIFVMENRRCLLNKCNSNPHEQVLISI